MFQFIAKCYAKARYEFNQHKEAETNLLHSALATQIAGEKRQAAARLAAEADAMDARIKEMDAKLETGFWECENGHETEPVGHSAVDSTGQIPLCSECDAPKKFIRRDQMTGQEKYECDKERGEAEKIAQEKRDQAKAQEEEAANSEKTAKYFHDLALQSRSVAEKIRRL